MVPLIGGLEWLHKLVTASTYDERYQMFLPCLSTSSDFIGSMFVYAIPLPVPGLELFDEELLSELSEEDQFKILNRNFAKDLDKGPSKAWHWAYQEMLVVELYYGLAQEQLRERGYVMFNFDRLYKWNVFSAPFDMQEAYKDWCNRRLEQHTDHFDMMKSWKERSNIWLRGGRGWWSNEDENKLIWLYPK